MVEIAGTDDLKAWLTDQPREVAVAIAARAALRVLPAVADYVKQDPADLAVLLALSMFRTVAVAQVASASLTRGAQERRPARSAANAVHSARAAAVGGHVLIRATATRAAIAAHTAASAAAATARATRTTRADLLTAAALDTARAAADAADDAAQWRAIRADVSRLEADRSSADLAQLPLWAEGEPDSIRGAWPTLKTMLLSLGRDWQVWTDWYDDILRGGEHPASRPLIEELEIARVLIPDEDWDKGPDHVNALIARLEAEY